MIAQIINMHLLKCEWPETCNSALLHFNTFLLLTAHFFNDAELLSYYDIDGLLHVSVHLSHGPEYVVLQSQNIQSCDRLLLLSGLVGTTHSFVIVHKQF